MRIFTKNLPPEWEIDYFSLYNSSDKIKGWLDVAY